MRPLLAVALLVGFAPAAPVPKTLKKQDDKDAILGTWNPAPGRTEWFEFKADGNMKAWNTGVSAASGVPYKWSIDPTATPKRMTWYSPGEAKPSWEGVYELDGDTLKVCSGGGKARPTELKAVGKGGMLNTFKRVKDEPKKDK